MNLNEVIGLICAVGALIIILSELIALKLLQRKNHKLESQLTDAVAALQHRQGAARQMGINQATGDMAQILGTFGLLAEYDEIMLLSTTSAQSSLDLMGLKDDRLDFIELKKAGADLTTSERRLRNLIAAGKLHVRYRVVDVTIPTGVNVSTRKITEGGQTQL